jgi:CO/xanthine dehydrogenase Mo-binding subunit
LKRASDSMMVPLDELTVVNGGVTHMKSERRMTFAELVNAQNSPILGQGHYANMKDGPEASMVAQVADVEVDPETGELTILRITSAHNTGTVLNPLSHQGQIDGGIVMGMGFTLTEELRTEEQGRVSTTNLGDYKLPNIKDAPVTKAVVVELPNGSGPYGSMSIGETALIPTAAAIANAVEDAVGVRITSLPITAEKISEALRLRAES